MKPAIPRLVQIRLLARLRHENLLFLLDFPADALTEFTVVRFLSGLV